MMNAQDDPFQEIETTLTRLRQQTKTRQRFPKEIWDTIIQLTKTYSVQIVSLRLNISPSYLKRKIQGSHETSSLDFREISSPTQEFSNMVYIEITSDSGVRAKIQGPPSCMNFLSTLFGR